MNIADFITELYCKIDDALPDFPHHPQAILSISELVTIGVLHAMKNVKQRPFYHWLKDNYGCLFPKLPHRTRLFRRLETQACWIGYFLAQPTVLGVADSYGIELRHPIREGRRERQIGRKGISNHRWPRIVVRGDVIVGGKLCVVQNQWGLITDWDCATANIHDQTFLPLLATYDGQMIVLTDTGFHRAKGDPANVKVCKRGQWNVRMTVATTFSMLTQVWGSKEMRHRTWAGFEAHLCYIVAAFNILVQWNGLQPDENGRIHRSIARFTL